MPGAACEGNAVCFFREGRRCLGPATKGVRGPARSAFGDLQLAPDVETGAFLDHEARHRLAPFRLDLSEAKALARFSSAPSHPAMRLRSRNALQSIKSWLMQAEYAPSSVAA